MGFPAHIERRKDKKKGVREYHTCFRGGFRNGGRCF